MTGTNGSAADHLRSFVDRIARLEEEKKAIATDIKDVYAEAIAMGFDRKALRTVVKESMETADQRSQREEIEAITDLYRGSLGMLDGTPLGQAARKRVSRPASDDDDDSGKEAGEGADGPEPEASDDPDIDADGTLSPEAIEAARTEGETAAHAGRRVTENPFLADDPRRAAWDEGWCRAAGSDGMDIPAAWRRKKSAKRKPSQMPGSGAGSEAGGEAGGQK